MFYIWQCTRFKKEELFWTGTVWTGVQTFGKLYSFDEALKIVEHRFHRIDPRPLIKRKSYFDERKKRKRKGKFNTLTLSDRIELGESDV